MSENPKNCPPDDLIQMAISDKVTFEEIYKKYGLNEKEVKVIMKTHLKLSSYINWRERVKQRQYKHRKKYASFKRDPNDLGWIVLNDFFNMIRLLNVFAITLNTA